MIKVLIFSFALFILAGCNPGSTSSSSSPNSFGTLLSVESGLAYDPATMQNDLTQNICFNIDVNSADCDYDLANVNTSQFGYFKVSQITQSVSNYKIIYNTPGVYGESEIVSGLVSIPANTTNIKGIVLYYHGTNENKNTVPSNFDPEFGQYYNLFLSEVFASQGYIVVAPDYVGLGDNKSVMHPYYSYPETNAASGIYMLKAARTFLNNIAVSNQNNELNLYVTGYSEGGTNSMWASYYLQNQYNWTLGAYNLKFKKSAPVSGAYNLTDIQVPFEFSNLSTSNNIFLIESTEVVFASKPTLIAYVLTSFGYYTYNSNYTQLMSPNFFNLVDIPVYNKSYNIYQIYNESINLALTDTQITEILTGQAQYLPNPINGINFSESNNSIAPLVESNLLNNQEFNSAMKNANIYSWKTSVPLAIIHLAHDSLVSPLNSTVAFESITSQSASGLVSEITISNESFIVNYHIIENESNTFTDHPYAGQTLGIAVLNYFNQ